MPKKLPTRQQPKRVPTLSSGRALGPKSPLTEPNVDIQSFLALCMSNWTDFYNDSEKKQILASLPSMIIDQNCPNERRQNRVTNSAAEEETATQNDRSLPPLSPDFVANDVYLKRAIARFKRDISEGFYEKSWQDKAKKAMEERKQGKFDEYLAESIEEMFSEEVATMGKDITRSDDESTNSEYAIGNQRSKNMGSKGNKRSKPNTKKTNDKRNRRMREESLLRDELALSDTGG